ncbi:hypothetical protein Q4577_11230 [Marinovum sp. 2_MG-2023]|uniref:hypothetical protein n=1 Tax=unclassified Marinovum TaxID=2647166 RepID=UPI0026E24A4C|nr:MULTISPECIES: hypothetical protein [unclassified Marinovum]MDO6730592.1 hypothetical protein [Marinovum sp. 2_MG-2023]MDO6778742.1 hypothetical protein [Marinovum sp. 1_MG-2023]
MFRFLPTLALLVFPALCFPAVAMAGDPEIVKVKVTKPDMGWRFEVTVRHDDAGWDHYADAWEVTDLDGKRLGYRKLHHPHEHEQPFTRSLRGLMIPDGIRVVLVRAHCSEHGWSSNPVEVKLSPSGRGSY